MSTNKLNNDEFDEMLGKALRQHSEPVSADFTERMSKQIREAEERKILARVILQERLALAGCIVLGVIAVVIAAVFPNIAVSFTEQIGNLTDKISQIIETISNQWRFYAVLAGVFGFAVYCLADLLVGDS